MNPSISLLKKTLLSALSEAGKILRSGFQRPMRISYKGPTNIVTEVDHAAEQKILRIIKSQFPDHGFLMEEAGALTTPSPYRWVIDPLDGTVNFAHGVPIACVSIGLEYQGKMLMGGVLDPFKNELYFAVRGKGAFLNNQAIHVSKQQRLISSLVVTGFPYDKKDKAGFYLSVVEKFLDKVQGIRRLGSAALDMCYVACGRFDGYWEFRIQPWDISAGWLLAEEAGGKVTDFQGKSYSLQRTAQTLCSNGLIHKEMLKVIKQAL